MAIMDDFENYDFDTLSRIFVLDDKLKNLVLSLRDSLYSEENLSDSALTEILLNSWKEFSASDRHYIALLAIIKLSAGVNYE